MATAPLLSIIIPCYNLAHFLPEAIQSCLDITQLQTEIIVVNDGSTDATAEVAASFPKVRYLYQSNQGLAAARNAGLSVAKGEFICFLDADDWLIPENFHYSIQMLREQQQLALVFGRHLVQQENGSLHHHPSVETCSYSKLLQSNLIGNPSTVLYRRSVACFFPFSSDPAFSGCEDYHQYLRISREYPIGCHQQTVAVYRRHQGNMSNNHAMMLHSVLQVLKTQKALLRNESEHIAWKQGRKAWLQYFGFFPLKAGQELHVDRYHWKLLRLLGWRLPSLLIQKIRNFKKFKIQY